MKKILIILIMICGVSLFAKENHTSVVVINSASWCPMCQEHGSRIKNEVVKSISENKNIKIILNDISNQETVKSSSVELEKVGLKDFTSQHKESGKIFVVDENHKVIGQMIVKESSQELISKINNLTNHK